MHTCNIPQFEGLVFSFPKALAHSSQSSFVFWATLVAVILSRNIFNTISFTAFIMMPYMVMDMWRTNLKQWFVIFCRSEFIIDSWPPWERWWKLILVIITQLWSTKQPLYSLALYKIKYFFCAWRERR